MYPKAVCNSSVKLSLQGNEKESPVRFGLTCRGVLPSFRLSNLKLPVRGASTDEAPESGVSGSPLQSIQSTFRPRTVSGAITRLTKAELVQEMQQRGLPDTGTKLDLRKRLFAAVQATQSLAGDQAETRSVQSPLLIC